MAPRIGWRALSGNHEALQGLSEGSFCRTRTKLRWNLKSHQTIAQRGQWTCQGNQLPDVFWQKLLNIPWSGFFRPSFIPKCLARDYVLKITPCPFSLQAPSGKCLIFTTTRTILLMVWGRHTATVSPAKQVASWDHSATGSVMHRGCWQRRPWRPWNRSNRILISSSGQGTKISVFCTANVNAFDLRKITLNSVMQNFAGFFDSVFRWETTAFHAKRCLVLLQRQRASCSWLWVDFRRDLCDCQQCNEAPARLFSKHTHLPDDWQPRFLSSQPGQHRSSAFLGRARRSRGRLTESRLRRRCRRRRAGPPWPGPPPPSGLGSPSRPDPLPGWSLPPPEPDKPFWSLFCVLSGEQQLTTHGFYTRTNVQTKSVGKSCRFQIDANGSYYEGFLQRCAWDKLIPENGHETFLKGTNVLITDCCKLLLSTHRKHCGLCRGFWVTTEWFAFRGILHSQRATRFATDCAEYEHVLHSGQVDNWWDGPSRTIKMVGKLAPACQRLQANGQCGLGGHRFLVRICCIHECNFSNHQRVLRTLDWFPKMEKRCWSSCRSTLWDTYHLACPRTCGSGCTRISTPDLLTSCGGSTTWS